MDPKKDLSEIVSKGLNRNVPSSFLDTLLRLYHLNTSKDQFSDAVGALGISADLAQTVYVFINDNIDALEKGAVLAGETT
ncbi:hypothetical protein METBISCDRAFT_28790 [Metschnikowia bicuspidata]|uniref:Uncharacterized protein n=1 Tax=Metschnikowia bicuspidata TaxID=27322 RepID=A0A4P9Z8E4_9ASCO|nr:hypothetical protein METBISCDRAFT_28790 [Metschnikowia bicuspidata]